MADGFYGIFYTGTVGSGFGVVVLHDGKVTGVDVTGGIFSGSFDVTNSELVGTVHLEVPAGEILVTGAPAQAQSYTLTIPLKVPADLGAGKPVLVKTPTGPINVNFKFLAPWTH